MDRESLLSKVKEAIKEMEPQSEIILYGSRARNDSKREADWDFLILLDGPVNDQCVDKIRHHLYEIEWESGEVLCSIVRNRQEWNSTPYKETPFHRNVEDEGVIL